MSNKQSQARKQRHVSWIHLIWYEIFRTSLWVIMQICFRVWHYGRKNVPWKGATLLVANHQSFLDPVAVGIGVWRRMNYLARKTLFKFKPFGWMINSLDAIPLDQEGIGFAGIKETLRRLKNEEAVLIFPEGSRCPDGKIEPFLEGYITLAFRSKATIVPVAVVGAFDVFPRGQKYPNFFKRPICIEYGTPILFEEYESLSEQEVHKMVEDRIRAMFDARMKKRGQLTDPSTSETEDQS